MPPKPFPTHFLSIPLATTASSRSQLSQTLASFAADVTAKDTSGSAAAAAIPSDAVRPVGTLHLTLGVCSFPPKNDEGKQGLEQAKDLLRSLRLREILAAARREVDARTTVLPAEEGVEGKEGEKNGMRDREGKGQEEEEKSLLITLRGLASMQTPAKTSVLYAHPVDDKGLLQTFCERVRGVFVEAGLMQEENGRPLLLHATVLNTIYVKNHHPPPPTTGEGGGTAGGTGGGGNKRKRGGGRGRRGEKLVFDARSLIDRYEDQLWLRDYPLEKIELCKMGAKKVEVDGVEDEVYEAVAEVGF